MWIKGSDGRLAGSTPGPGHANWKGGRRTHDGYILIRILGDKEKFEHRIVMEQFLGRDLLPNEHVHHINGKRGDNRIENLELVSLGKHNTIHKKGSHPSEEARARMRDSHLDWWRKHPDVPDETRAKMRAANLGRPKSEEHKAKLRANHLGKKLSAEHKEKIGLGLREYHKLRLDSGHQV
jgi:HNH endonuclease